MSLTPLTTYDGETSKLLYGSLIDACAFCKKAFQNKPECANHYKSLSKKSPGYYQCPFGFTSRSFYFEGKLRVITGLIAHPRFGTANEMKMSKSYPKIRFSRDGIEAMVAFYESIEKSKADAYREAAKIFPQAFHELRKLNGAVLQHAERERREGNNSPSLQSIVAAAELMRNNFDILEALSNIDAMKALPSDSTINLYDLVYKMKRVLSERSNARGMQIIMDGVRAIVRGSQKSFPIVPAVLLENAIRYGIPGEKILVNVMVSGKTAIFTVENKTDLFIDIDKCFERGTRYASSVEGGGYGLYLAKEIVVSHGGNIRCQLIGESVKMVVELPLKDVIAFNKPEHLELF